MLLTIAFINTAICVYMEPTTRRAIMQHEDPMPMWLEVSVRILMWFVAIPVTIHALTSKH